MVSPLDLCLGKSQATQLVKPYFTTCTEAQPQEPGNFKANKQTIRKPNSTSGFQALLGLDRIGWGVENHNYVLRDPNSKTYQTKVLKSFLDLNVKISGHIFKRYLSA